MGWLSTRGPLLAGLGAAALLSACGSMSDVSLPDMSSLGGDAGAVAESPYFARVEVSDEPAADQTMVRGTVFEDKNRDGRRQSGERGVAGVLVSNGLEIVSTNGEGGYVLPAREDMSVSVVQPSGWRVPTNEVWVPQFSYEHKEKGSTKTMRFGGLAPTGPVPAEINFPLVRAALSDEFNCAALGDLQAYSNKEVGYARGFPCS